PFINVPWFPRMIRELFWSFPMDWKGLRLQRISKRKMERLWRLERRLTLKWSNFQKTIEESLCRTPQLSKRTLRQVRPKNQRRAERRDLEAPFLMPAVQRSPL